MEENKKKIIQSLKQLFDDSYFEYLATLNYRNITNKSKIPNLTILNETEYNDAINVIIEIMSERIFSLGNQESNQISRILEKGIRAEKHEILNY